MAILTLVTIRTLRIFKKLKTRREHFPPKLANESCRIEIIFYPTFRPISEHC
jgi:hypothetical protein